MAEAAEQFDGRAFDVLNGTFADQRINGLPLPRDPGDDRLWVKFERCSHLNDAESREQKRPIFEMRDYIRIVVPGDQTTTVHRPIRESDKIRFPRQWEAYKAGKEAQVTGFPLTEWGQMTRAQCDELAYFKIQTVEQLAGLADNLLQRFPGLSTLRDQAKLYLEERKVAAPVEMLRGEIGKRDETIAAMQAQMKQMQAKIEEMSTAASKKK